jgi:hypothetical protein
MAIICSQCINLPVWCPPVILNRGRTLCRMTWPRPIRQMTSRTVRDVCMNIFRVKSSGDVLHAREGRQADAKKDYIFLTKCQPLTETVCVSVVTPTRIHKRTIAVMLLDARLSVRRHALVCGRVAEYVQHNNRTTKHRSVLLFVRWTEHNKV